MERYIDAERLKGIIRVNLMPNVDVDGTVTVENAERYFLNLIEKQPTADVVEVKHGEWKFINQATNYLESPCGDTCHCSVCGFQIDVSETHFKRCPECGAKMDGKGDT